MIRKYNATENSTINDIVDRIQTNFNCCGADSPKDWRENAFYKNNDLLPKSCCKDLPDSQQCGMATQHFTDGCVEIISDELRYSITYLGWVLIAVIVLQIIGLAFSCTISARRAKYNYV